MVVKVRIKNIVVVSVADECAKLIRSISLGATKLGPAREQTAQHILEGIAKAFPNKTADEIPCEDLFHTFLDPTGAYANGTTFYPAHGSKISDCDSFKASGPLGNRTHFAPMRTYFLEAYEAITNTTICNNLHPDPVFEHHWAEYDGFCSWEPAEWRSAASWMMELIKVGWAADWCPYIYCVPYMTGANGCV